MSQSVNLASEAISYCYHCGNTCADNRHLVDSKSFCCNGCKTVYEILEQNSMCDYYSFEAKPGVSFKNTANQEFEYLDDEKIKQSVLNFQEGTISGVTFHIPSIHCSSCIWLLENLQKINPAITRTHIHFQKKELEVQFDTGISLRQLAQLLASLGYSPLITLDGKEVSKSTVDKSLLYKLGVAGFCSSNILMLSLPDYLSVFDDVSSELKVLFGVLSIILALPVFFYSASDYFFSSWQSIKNRVINIDLPIALGLVAAFGQSTYEIISGTGEGYMDSFAGLVFFLLIGKWYQQKTYAALNFERDYKSYFPLAATLVDGGSQRFVQLSELQVGDTILVKNQEIIPADGIIMEGDGNIDYSFVTGESVPIPKKNGQQVFSGGKQAGPTLKIMITKAVSQSYLTQLWNRDNIGHKISGLSEYTNKIGKYFTIVVLLISLGSYLYWVDENSQKALYAAVTVLIIFCPCIFSLAIPFCFGNAMNILGKNGFFLKNADAMEKLAAVDTIVFDKTGTITTVGDSQIEFEGKLSEREMLLVKSLVVHSTHPLSRKIADYFSSISMTLNPDEFSEFASQGITARFGADDIRLGSAGFVQSDDMPEQGERTSTSVYVSVNEEVLGRFVFKNMYREGLDDTLTSLSSQYDLHLLSGDNDGEKKSLVKYFKNEFMRFFQSPMDKLKYVQLLGNNRNVLMIGDGLNDAGALMSSYCGISVTENSGNFTPACDAILEADKFPKLTNILKFAKSCQRTIYLSLFVALCYNVIGLYYAVQGNLKPLIAAILMPLSSVSVVLFVVLVSRAWARYYKLR
jgi:Cu+-exporting ATPase